MSDEPQEPVADGGPASGDGSPRAPGEPAAGDGNDEAGTAASGPPSRPLGRRAQAAAKKAEREAAKKAEEIRALRDAEVPADAYVVELPTFQGPLDLLLHLIQKHELDILDIPVSFVTEKYLAYLDVMRKLSIDVASEYLVMAATLLHIKSKMLLPQLPGGQDEVGEEEEEDPRAELVRRLLDYQKYKAAAEELGDNPSMLGRDVFGRGSEEIAPPGPAPFQPFGVFNLFDAFEKVLARTKAKIEHNVVFDRISITDRIVELTQKMKNRRQMLFEELFDADRTTFEVVITFLAMLEMCKLKLMRVYQADVLASIHVELMVVDEIAEGDELEFAQSGGQSLASGPLPPPIENAESVGASADVGEGGRGDEDGDEVDEDDDDDEEDDEDDDEDDDEEDDDEEDDDEEDDDREADADAASDAGEPVLDEVVEEAPEAAAASSVFEADEGVPEAAAAAEPVVEASPEPVLETSPELAVEAAPAPVEGAPELVVEPVPEPVVEPDLESAAVEVEPAADITAVEEAPAPEGEATTAETAPTTDADAAFEAEFAALLAEEEAERQAALAAQAADETKPPDGAPATVDD